MRVNEDVEEISCPRAQAGEVNRPSVVLVGGNGEGAEHVPIGQTGVGRVDHTQVARSIQTDSEARAGWANASDGEIAHRRFGENAVKAGSISVGGIADLGKHAVGLHVGQSLPNLWLPEGAPIDRVIAVGNGGEGE